MAEKTEEEIFLEAHQKERDVLFSNEAFVIGVLQAVSGGSLFAALAQSETLLKLAGKLPFLIFLTLMGIGLVSAVLAAYCVPGKWENGVRLELLHSVAIHPAPL